MPPRAISTVTAQAPASMAFSISSLGVVRVTHHPSVSYGNQRHPWTVLCEYRYEGRTYTARSTFLWDETAGSTAKIFLNT